MEMRNHLQLDASAIVPVAMQIQTIANPTTTWASSCHEALLVLMSVQVRGKMWERTKTEV